MIRDVFFSVLGLAAMFSFEECPSFWADTAYGPPPIHDLVPDEQGGGATPMFAPRRSDAGPRDDAQAARD